MNHLLNVRWGLLLATLAIDLGIYLPARADINQKILQNHHTEQQRKQLKKQSASQELWERFRQRQDVFRLQQQQRLEQLRIENKVRQQPFRQLRINQTRQQQRQEIETLRLQQKLRNP